MNPKQPSQGIKLVYLIGLLFGLAIIGWQTLQWQQQKTSLQWPVTAGKILDSQLVYVPGRSSHYRADIMYNYFANGTRQVSHQISLWSPDLSSYGSIARTFVANHTNGSPVDVYYDPVHPENAVLIPGADDKSNLLLASMGGFSALVSIVGLIARMRKEPRLRALLNDPAAETRTISMSKADILRGSTAFAGHFFFSGIVFIFTAAISLAPLFAGPSNLPGAPVSHPWQWVVGVAGLVTACFILRRGMRQAHCTECPFCGNFLNKTTFTTGRCDGCGTRIIFDGVPVTPTTTHTHSSRPAMIRGFHKDRFINVAGFMSFPILFVWLCCTFDAQLGPGLAVLVTLLFSMVGGLFYFCPEKAAGETQPSTGKATAEESPRKLSTYWLDFSIILSPALLLLSYLLYLVWFRQTLDIPGLVVLVIGFPSALVVVTYICKYRFIRDQKSNAPKPPAFVPLSLIALWLGGTFISVLFLACLVFKYIGHK